MKEKDREKWAHYRDRIGALCLFLLLFVWHLAGIYH